MVAKLPRAGHCGAPISCTAVNRASGPVGAERTSVSPVTRQVRVAPSASRKARSWRFSSGSTHARSVEISLLNRSESPLSW